jgi:dTDP-4-dehydrorhamnose reductase
MQRTSSTTYSYSTDYVLMGIRRCIARSWSTDPINVYGVTWSWEKSCLEANPNAM